MILVSEFGVYVICVKVMCVECVNVCVFVYECV